MNKIIFAYWEHFDDLRKVNIYDEKQRSVEESAFLIDMPELFRVILFKKNKSIEKKMSLEEVEELLSNKCNFKMVVIVSNMKKEIYSVISNVSRLRGICSPFIELENSIMYFPQLSYSDLGFLKYLCEQKNMKNYKLHIVSSCRGGKYV